MDRAKSGQLGFALHNYPESAADAGRNDYIIDTDCVSSDRLNSTSEELVHIPDCIRLSMPILAVVEILPELDGATPRNLLWKAYSASRAGTVVLALNGVTIVAANRVLDAIVPYFPLTIPGVLYVDAANEPLLGWILARAPVIFGRTSRFCALAPRYTPVITPAQANLYGFGPSSAAAVG